jgi:hypothetical protein
MSVCFECCVLSGRDLCNELITRPEKPYRLWCVIVCDLETSWMRRPWPTGGWRTKKKIILDGRKILTRFWLGIVKEWDHFEDQVDGWRIDLAQGRDQWRAIMNKYWLFGFHKMREFVD